MAIELPTFPKAIIDSKPQFVAQRDKDAKKLLLTRQGVFQEAQESESAAATQLWDSAEDRWFFDSAKSSAIEAMARAPFYWPPSPKHCKEVARTEELLRIATGKEQEEPYQSMWAELHKTIKLISTLSLPTALTADYRTKIVEGFTQASHHASQAKTKAFFSGRFEDIEGGCNRLAALWERVDRQDDPELPLYLNSKDVRTRKSAAERSAARLKEVEDSITQWKETYETRVSDVWKQALATRDLAKFTQFTNDQVEPFQYLGAETTTRHKNRFTELAKERLLKLAQEDGIEDLTFLIDTKNEWVTAALDAILKTSTDGKVLHAFYDVGETAEGAVRHEEFRRTKLLPLAKRANTAVLEYAAKEGKTAHVRSLLLQEVDPKKALALAAEKGSEPLVRDIFLYRQRDQVDPFEKNAEGKSPFLLAAKQGHIEVVRRMLMNRESDWPYSKLFSTLEEAWREASSNPQNAPILKLFLQEMAHASFAADDSPTAKQKIEHALMITLAKSIGQGGAEIIRDLAPSYTEAVSIADLTPLLRHEIENRRELHNLIRHPFTPLQVALLLQNLPVLETLVNQLTSQRLTAQVVQAMRWAEEEPDEITCDLLKTHLDEKLLNQPDGSGETPLAKAVEGRNTTHIKNLISIGCGINHKITKGDLEGYTPLMLAAKQEPEVDASERPFDILLKTPGVDINAISTSNKTALVLAVEGKRQDDVERLLAKGALTSLGNYKVIDIAAGVGDLALFQAVYRASQTEIRGAAIEPGVLAEGKVRHKQSIEILEKSLRHAAAAGKATILDFLYASGSSGPAALESRDEIKGVGRDAPLFLAAKNGHATVARKLLREWGFPLSETDRLTLLKVAAREKHKEVVRLLLPEASAALLERLSAAPEKWEELAGKLVRALESAAGTLDKVCKAIATFS